MTCHPDDTARRRARSPGGFSLVELLVAMTLGLILLGGMMSVFAGNRRASDINAATATMQESVRFAMNAIAADVRMAGHQGCLDLNKRRVSVIASSPPTADLWDTAVGGAIVDSAAWDPQLALGTGAGRFTEPAAAVAGTHALAVQFGGPEVSTLAVPLANAAGSPDPSAPVTATDSTLPLGTGDLALIATCESGELFQVTSRTAAGTRWQFGHDAPANTQGSFAEAYGNGANGPAQVLLMPFRTHVYYIGETDQENEDGEKIRALFQQSAPFNEAGNPPVELVRGVENMRLSFGIGDADGNLRYVSSDDGAYDSSQIRSVRIGLLMSSDEEIAADVDTKSYSLAGQLIAPAANAVDGTSYKADRRLRLAFNTTVKVRNRRAAN